MDGIDRDQHVALERFFVRNHTATPVIDPATYRLEVFGSGLRRPAGISLSLRDLQPLPSHTVTAFIECAGNGRSFFGGQQGTPVPGSQWKLGAVGVARWRGVRLRHVLERAGITRHAVKWVARIEVADHALFSAWNTTQYRLTGPTYPPDSPPLTNQAVKSAFELPFGAQLKAGRPHLLTGRSWSGRAPIERVDVSVDGGRHFKRAQLHGANLPNSWVRWRFPLTPRAPGPLELQVRATDRVRRTQPATVPFDDAGYLFWAVVKHPVQVV